MLTSDLRLRGFDVLPTREPGGTPLGRRLRESFLETEETVAPLAELLLFAADRAQHVEFLVRPALAAGKTVISDRYADATFAYQGAGRGFPERTVNQVIKLATGGLKPDLTLFFDTAIETAMSRKNIRAGGGELINRMDGETHDFYRRVRESYLQIAAKETKRFRIFDGNDSIEEIHARVWATVAEFFGL